MKKLILAFIIILMTASLVSAGAICPSKCNGGGGTEGGPSGQSTYPNAYIPPIDAPGCPNVCVDRPGAIDYDGESLSIFNYQTGEGYTCRKPKNNGYAMFPVCFCDKVDELIKHHPYGLTLEVMTPGASFYSEASIAPDMITVLSFKGKEDACGGAEPTSVSHLSYIYDDERESVIVTDTSTHLLTKDLYLGVLIPPIIVDQSVVPEGTVIKVRITLYDGKQVCAPYCTEPLCNCTIPVAIMACWNDCCATLPYLVTSGSWWTGIVIANLSDHDGSAAITYIQGDKAQLRVHQLKAGEVKAFVANQEDLPFGSCWAVVNSGFSMRTLVILGDGTQCYGYLGTSCNPCQ